MENGRTRFDRVIESVYNYLDRYDEGVFTVIIIGRNPLVLEREVDREAVEYVVDRLIPFGEESSIGASLRRAGDLLGERDGRIVVISDFVTTDGSDLEYEKDLLENEGKTVIFNDISEGFQEEVEVFEPEVIEEEIEEVIVEEQKLAVIMDKNTVYELDLGEHFIDADNDELIFSVQEPDNVKIEIEGNIAQFIPEEDWYGTTSAVFTADDGKGGVEEGQVVIFVNDKAEEVLGPQEIVAEIVEEVNGDEEEMLVDAVEEVQELPEIVYVEDEKKGYNWFKIFGYVAAALAVWLLLIYVVVAARK